MYSVSTAFQTEVTRSHAIAVQAVLYNGDAPNTANPLKVKEGYVSVDGNAAVRRTCELTLIDPAGLLTPDIATGIGPAAPYGVELRLHRGVKFADGTTELVPLGVFGLSVNRITDGSGGRLLQVKGYDRSRQIARNRFTDEYVVAAGQNYVSAIQSLISSRWTRSDLLVSRATPTDLTTPLIIHEAGSDPWAKAQDMAASIGYELYFDPVGVLVLQPVPVAGDTPVAVYAEGPTSVLLELDSELSNEDGYNGVIMTGESTTLAAPVRGEAWDTSPTSPTYYLGQYGKVPDFQTSPYVTNQVAADAAAAAALQKLLGLTQQVGFSIIPNPAHEPGDVVTVTRLASGVNSDFVLQAFDVPLQADGTMGMTMAKRIVR